ncbi:MAG: response regulator transcription factor, partial [Firmicutes bacterium]|nr:response regulator transcription factor [Bacillota bacterium]
ADRLGIETGTVKSHINHLLRKTALNNRTELAIEARLKGLVVGLGRQ